MVVFKKGFYQITVHDKKHFGFRNVIGRLEKDTKPPFLFFHIGYTSPSKDLENNEYLGILYPAEADVTKIPGRMVETKVYKNGKERYVKYC